MDKKHCVGCYNDYYNHGNNSNTGECWLLKRAKLIMRKRVHINQRPPWKQKARKYPNCYRETGYVFVGPNQEY